MNVLVCVKAVPSTGSVQVDGAFRLQRDGAKLEWNVSDLSALEAALSLKGPEGRVTVVTMGPKKLEEPLRELFARGVDEALLLTDRAFAGADTFATANALEAAVKNHGPFDLILCGRRAIDGETGQVPSMLAAALALPCITGAERITPEGSGLLVRRPVEEGVQMLFVPMPAVISLCEYTYSLRLPGIMGLRRAKGKAVTLLSPAELGIDKENLGLSGSLTRVIQMDSKFPGLRKGPKTDSLSQGIPAILSVIKEAKR